jgi:hypothetical protein
MGCRGRGGMEELRLGASIKDIAQGVFFARRKGVHRG